MSDAPICPACGSDHVAAGHVTGGNIRPHFTPDGMRLLPGLAAGLGEALVIAGAAAACTVCGLLWMRIEPVRLRAALRAGGTEAERRRLGIDTAPETPDGLPVFPRRRGGRHDAAG